ncbi:sensor histidine kinase [Streptomyces sp. NBC_00878]|uniref:sensor histidine kinase n=1 Tax=Streptomyces sp. NBC_00878 TaxID=2975854 RepID=UPI00225903AC|nr:sensor histidine kinase [Streptomyces sp. NBC_00878]MCX4908273.1 sensor histidine kinase [Streptomyces sp. NBC_00878]
MDRTPNSSETGAPPDGGNAPGTGDAPPAGALPHPAPRRSCRSVVFDSLVACVTGMFALPMLAGLDSPALLINSLAMVAALLWRRRRPVQVLAAVAALALCQVVFLDPRALPVDVATLVAMYSVVRYGRDMRSSVLAAVVIGTGVGFQLLQLDFSEGAGPALLYVTVCSGVWMAGYAMRARDETLRALEERAALAERDRDHLAQLVAADERAAIARELHDVVAHGLSVMIVQADGAACILDPESEQARGALEVIASTGRDALEDMHLIVGILRGTRTLPDADRRVNTVDEIGTLVERARAGGLRAELHVTGDASGISAAEQLTVYRIVQEALTNVLRHAGASPAVDVRLLYAPDKVTVVVTDDGAGQLATDAGVGVASGGHGLVGMRERVAVHGGTIESGARLGGGWRVSATIPFKGTHPDRVRETQRAR